MKWEEQGLWEVSEWREKGTPGWNTLWKSSQQVLISLASDLRAGCSEGRQRGNPRGTGDLSVASVRDLPGLLTVWPLITIGAPVLAFNRAGARAL